MKQRTGHTRPRFISTPLRAALSCGVLVLLFVAVVLCKSCSMGGAAMQELEHVRSMVRTEPGEALELMRSLDAHSYTTEQQRANYALAYCEALYYADVAVDNDSLSRVAVNYFAHSKEHDKRARAYYYHGIIMHKANHRSEAMLSFMEAEASLHYIDDPYITGLICRAKGDIYGEGCLYKNAFDEYLRSKTCFERANLPEHVAYSNYDLGRFALAQREYEVAERYLMEAYNYAVEAADNNFIQIVVYDLSELYVQLGEYERCAEVLNMHEKCGYEIFDLSHHYSLLAIISAVRDDKEAAYDYIELAESAEPQHEVLITYAKYCVNRIFGNDSEALKWLEWSNQRQDDTILSALEQPVLNYQIGKLQSTIESKEREARLRSQRNIAIYIIVAVAVVAIFAYVLGRMRKKNRDIQHYIETINELQLTRSDSSAPMAEAVDLLYNDRLVDLNRLCETYYDHSDTSRHAAKVFEQVRQTIESIKSDEGRLAELEGLVNNFRGGLMSKLRSQCPKLNERELKVALYSFAGFSSRAICIFVESNPVALSKIKYRIKTKIKESGAVDADMLISAMNDH
ncbi:MAG: hypothetical protein IKC12_01625 [Alistipes sp.]|nr:hypothetical protein [Alistipes sp.]